MAAKGKTDLPLSDAEVAAKLRMKERERQAKLTYEREQISKSVERDGSSVAPMIES